MPFTLDSEKLQKVLNVHTRLVEAYINANSNWLEIAGMQFLHDTYHSLYHYYHRGDFGKSTTNVSLILNLEVGKPDEQSLVEITQFTCAEICCQEQLIRKLMESFFHQKIDALLQVLVGPAIMRHQGKFHDILLPTDLLQSLKTLKAEQKALALEKLTRPYRIRFSASLPSGRSKSTEPIKFITAVAVAPLVIDMDQDLAYYPVTVSARLVGTRRGDNENLMVTALQSLIEIIHGRIPEEKVPANFPGIDSSTGSRTPHRFQPSEYGHADDFSQWWVVQPNGERMEWKFRGRRLDIIKFLWEKLTSGFPDAHFDDILVATNIEAFSKSRWHDQWRSQKGLLGTLIVTGKRGYYRLNIEPETKEAP